MTTASSITALFLLLLASFSNTYGYSFHFQRPTIRKTTQLSVSSSSSPSSSPSSAQPVTANNNNNNIVQRSTFLSIASTSSSCLLIPFLASSSLLLLSSPANAKDIDPALKGTKSDPAFQACLGQCMYDCTKPKGSEQRSRAECLPECKSKCATSKEQLMTGTPLKKA